MNPPRTAGPMATGKRPGTSARASATFRSRSPRSAASRSTPIASNVAIAVSGRSSNALAEMYGQGVSTRKVAAVVELSPPAVQRGDRHPAELGEHADDQVRGQLVQDEGAPLFERSVSGHDVAPLHSAASWPLVGVASGCRGTRFTGRLLASSGLIQPAGFTPWITHSPAAHSCWRPSASASVTSMPLETGSPGMPGSWAERRRLPSRSW